MWAAAGTGSRGPPAARKPYTPDPMADPGTQGLIERFASRLRYPQLFFAVAVLFLIDLVIPDAIPFAEEILLGLLTVLLGRLRKPPEAPERRQIKDVTPRGGG